MESFLVKQINESHARIETLKKKRINAKTAKVAYECNELINYYNGKIKMAIQTLDEIERLEMPGLVHVAQEKKVEED